MTLFRFLNGRIKSSTGIFLKIFILWQLDLFPLNSQILSPGKLYTDTVLKSNFEIKKSLMIKRKIHVSILTSNSWVGTDDPQYKQSTSSPPQYPNHLMFIIYINSQP